jgi:hypothetical protein
MGAAAEWRRAGDREDRLVGEVDPEVAAELHRRELENARWRAKQYRRVWGWNERDRKLAEERRKEARRVARRQRREAARAARPTHVERLVAAGWRVEAETDEFTELVYQGPPHPIPVWAHLAMSVVTVGLWLPVWWWKSHLPGVRRRVRKAAREGRGDVR